VEICDLTRYLNSIIFSHHVIRIDEAVALNRMGIHPIENLSGVVRLVSHHDHSWDNFIGSIRKAMMMDEIVAAQGLKSSVQ
jgi:hypothetical protein